MPGVKRKQAPSSAAAGNTPAASSSKGKKVAKKAAPAQVDSEDDDEEFDDGEDLLAASHALNGGEDSDDDDDDDSEMEGGFEDLEAAGNGNGAPADDYEDSDDADEDGFEDLEGGDGDGDEDDADAAPSKRAKNAHLYAPPTNEEMQGLRETGDLFKSNIVKLQIEEMLENVRPAYHKTAPLETALRRLQEVFAAIPSIKPRPVSEASQAIQSIFPFPVHIPFADPQPSSSANYKFAFEPPTGLQLVGSWPLKVATMRPEGIDVDLAVTMPSSLFQEKDHLNMRYFHKRAFYLAVLAAAISAASDKLGLTAAYELEGADAKKPMLVLQPIKNKGDTDFTKLKAEIRIRLAHELDIFPVGRLAPSRNNFRTNTESNDASSSSAAAAAAGEAATPTPRYNAAILFDSMRTPHLLYLHATAKACPAFADACALLKVWSFQRGFGSGTSSKSTNLRRTVLGTENARFVLTMVLAHLLHGEDKTSLSSSSSRLAAPRAKLANSFSSYQLFRGVIDWLANHPFREQPVFMKAAASMGVPSLHNKVDREDFSRHFDYAILDPSGALNLVANWSSGSLDLLQHEAKITAAMLDDGDADRFDDLFLTPRGSPLSVFDDCANIHATGLPQVTKLAKVDHGSEQHCNAAIIAQTLRRGLTGRSHFSSLLTLAPSRESRSWSLHNDAKRKRPSSHVELGVVYNGSLALRSVEHGPAPEAKDEAAAFQTFWGDVAELRRFKDGRILWSIVWEIAGQSERWGIPRRIIRHLLGRLELPSAAKVTFQGEAFEGLTEVPREVAERAFLASPQEKGFQMVQSAFDNLARQLRAMDDLPLSLISITPNASGLRGTSTMIPGPVNVGALGSLIPDSASHIPAQEIVLTFESSGRWPDDLAAIQGMKIAFLERLATLLPEKLTDVQAHVALDEDAEDSEIQDQAALEILLPSGFAFRARIHHDRERVLLERVISDKRDTPLPRRQEASRALQRYTQRFLTGPAHHAAIATLTHRFLALGETIRLLKRWTSSQMMDGQVSEELLELIAASVFICPGSVAPSSGAAGFVQVLNKLATWKWQEEPLLLPIQSVVRAADDAALKNLRFPTDAGVSALEAFKKHRRTDPSLSSKAWFIATEEDVESEHWASNGPSGPIAHAVQDLARGAVALLGAQSVSHLDSSVVRALFTPSLKPYHFVICLKSGVSPRYVESLAADPTVYAGGGNKKTFRNNAVSTASSSSSSLYGSTPRIAFDPMTSFVTLLRSIYGDSLRLHFDAHGQTAIGGLFNPTLAMQPRKFKVGLGFNSQPAAADSTTKDVKLNYRAVLAEVERLGVGLVEKIEVQKEF